MAEESPSRYRMSRADEKEAYLRSAIGAVRTGMTGMTGTATSTDAVVAADDDVDD